MMRLKVKTATQEESRVFRKNWVVMCGGGGGGGGGTCL